MGDRFVEYIRHELTQANYSLAVGTGTLIFILINADKWPFTYLFAYQIYLAFSSILLGIIIAAVLRLYVSSILSRYFQSQNSPEDMFPSASAERVTFANALATIAIISGCFGLGAVLVISSLLSGGPGV